MAAFLLSDASKDVTGQIFGVRMNEIFLFSQNRPLRSVQRSEGWTPQTIAEHAMPALKPSFYKLDRSGRHLQLGRDLSEISIYLKLFRAIRPHYAGLRAHDFLPTKSQGRKS